MAASGPRIGNLVTTLSVDVSAMRADFLAAQQLTQQQMLAIQRQMQASVDAMRTGLNEITASANNLNASMDRVVNRFASFRGIVASALQFQLTMYAMQGWDFILHLPSKLATAADKLELQMLRINSLTMTSTGFMSVMDASNRMGVSLETYTGLFQRFAVAKEATALTTEQLVQMTDTLINLGRLGGIGIEELTTRSIQLAQGVASGRLQGDELRAVLEGMPIVIREIARELNIPMDQLRKMASEGKITGKAIADALLKIGPRMAEEFAKIPLTLEMINQQMATQSGLLMAHIAEVTGLGDAWKNAMKELVSYMETARVEGAGGVLSRAMQDLGASLAESWIKGFKVKVAEGDLVGGGLALFGLERVDKRNWYQIPRGQRSASGKSPWLETGAMNPKEYAASLQDDFRQMVEDMAKATAWAMPEELSKIDYVIFDQMTEAQERLKEVRNIFVKALQKKEKMTPDELLEAWKLYTQWRKQIEDTMQKSLSELEGKDLLDRRKKVSAVRMRQGQAKIQKLTDETLEQHLKQLAMMVFDVEFQKRLEIRLAGQQYKTTFERNSKAAQETVDELLKDFTEKLLGVTAPEYLNKYMRQLKARDEALEKLETLEKETPGVAAAGVSAVERGVAERVTQFFEGYQQHYIKILQNIALENQRIASGEKEISTVRDLNVTLQEKLNLAHKDGYVIPHLDEIIERLVKYGHTLQQNVVQQKELTKVVEDFYQFWQGVQTEEQGQTTSQLRELNEQKAALLDIQAINAQLSGDTRRAEQLRAEAVAIRQQNAALVENARLGALQGRIRSQNIRGPADLQQAIQAAGAQYGVDPALITAMMSAESGFNPNAISNKNAAGLMQLIPSTAKRFGVTNRFDPMQSLHGGVRYLAWLTEYLKSIGLPGLDNLIAAYNAGEGAVEKYGGVPPYQETITYIQRVKDRLGPAGAPSSAAGIVGYAGAQGTQRQALEAESLRIQAQIDVEKARLELQNSIIKQRINVESQNAQAEAELLRKEADLMEQRAEIAGLQGQTGEEAALRNQAKIQREKALALERDALLVEMTEEYRQKLRAKGVEPNVQEVEAYRNSIAGMIAEQVKLDEQMRESRRELRELKEQEAEVRKAMRGTTVRKRAEMLLDDQAQAALDRFMEKRMVFEGKMGFGSEDLVNQYAAALIKVEQQRVQDIQDEIQRAAQAGDADRVKAAQTKLRLQEDLVAQMQLELELDEWALKYQEQYYTKFKMMPRDVEEQVSQRRAAMNAIVQMETEADRMRREKMLEVVTDTDELIKKGVQGLEGVMSETLTKAMEGSFEGILLSFKKMVDQMVIYYLTQQAMFALFGREYMKGLPGAGISGWIGQGLGLLGFGKATSGTGISSLVNSATRLKFAEGGVVPGLSSDAVPAIVHGGEVVLTQEQARALGGGRGGRTYNVILNVNAPMDTGTFRRSERSLSVEAARSIQRATMRNL